MTSWPIGQLALLTLLNEKVNTVFLWVSLLKSVTGHTRNTLTSVLAMFGLSFRACWLFCIRLLHYLFTPRPEDCMNLMTIPKTCNVCTHRMKSHHSIAMRIPNTHPQHKLFQKPQNQNPKPKPRKNNPKVQTKIRVGLIVSPPDGHVHVITSAWVP